MNSSEKLAEICEQLDTTALEYLDLISSYEEQWKRISKELEKGFLSLAHAKYAMGPSSLTQHQYDGRMKADTRILISEDQEANNELGQNNSRQIILINVSDPELDVLSTDDIVDKPLETGGLRQRNVRISEKENEKLNFTKKGFIKNPLNWFGVLVPSSLRESQNSFKQATTPRQEQAYPNALDLDFEKRYQEFVASSVMDAIEEQDDEETDYKDDSSEGDR
ncbi:846_t:CDS:2 [Ambispora leptoticha]|uniref:Vacuolar ATPase assembly protein VMA22 n=1 Tax=Ambispora leptoticha TaxID=144679 RepID=A0A9N8VDF9_9GLOM|nr:846_t:CDS:2 [Ambispora leptoticha]